MTDAATAVLSKLEALLDMDGETILTQSLRGFIAEKTLQVQQRISQLYLEHQRFVHKYGESLDAFCRHWTPWRTNPRRMPRSMAYHYSKRLRIAAGGPMCKKIWPPKRPNSNNSRRCTSDLSQMRFAPVTGTGNDQ